MELTPKQQIQELINKSKNILIVTKQDSGGDSIGSMLGFYLFLKKLGKEVMMVCHGKISPVYEFLPEFNKITSRLESTKDFVISLDISNTKVEQFSYSIEGNKLKIYITPKNGGKFDQSHLSTSSGNAKFDLVISLDCPDLRSFGKIYEENAEFFYEVPIINIDHNASNEYFGKVNMVDITASSTAEILLSLLETINKKLLDEKIATCLLTGVIADTNSFQNQLTTPKSFTIAAQLISYGADQQKIVQKLFKTKSLNILKLWGRVLARIKYDDESKMVWSLIDLSDFEKTQTSPKDLDDIMLEFMNNSPDANIILLLAKINTDKIKGILHTSRKMNASKIAAEFNGHGNERLANFEIKNNDLVVCEKEVVKKIKEKCKIT